MIASHKYFEHDDRIVGCEDLDSFDCLSTSAVKHALQFMVRGISTKWKQPVGHFCSGNSIDSKVLKSMVVDIIAKLEGFGLYVVALVCDQEASHRVCLNALDVATDNPVCLKQRERGFCNA